jgi:hypothetical protein
VKAVVFEDEMRATAREAIRAAERVLEAPRWRRAADPCPDPQRKARSEGEEKVS